MTAGDHRGALRLQRRLPLPGKVDDLGQLFLECPPAIAGRRRATPPQGGEGKVVQRHQLEWIQPADQRLALRPVQFVNAAAAFRREEHTGAVVALCLIIAIIDRNRGRN